MAGGLLGRLSGTNNPHIVNIYTPAANEKNMLTTTDYFKLLVAQSTNQDTTNPMDNNGMMVQITQMAMMRVVSTMTESVRISTSVSIQVYAAGLVGQEITAVVTEKSVYGQPIAMDIQYGEVESVDFIRSTPVLKLVGDDNECPLSYVLRMGKIDDPYKRDEDDGRQAKEDDMENEKVDFLSNECAIQGDNPLTSKDVFA